MKKLVIISGVTGAVGSALLAEFGQEQDTVIYGISRKAKGVEYLTQTNGKLPPSTLICSIPSFDLEGYHYLVKEIDHNAFQEVVYIHALGVYPFEIDQKGNHVVENDLDNDGVNDSATQLTLNAFIGAAQNVINSFPGKVTCVLFGGLADKYKPLAHSSWWKTIEQTKKYMRSAADKRISMLVFNISSLLCPHEIILRPFVFSQTDADPRYWLHPHELARFVIEKTMNSSGGFHEFDQFRVKPNFDSNYYRDDQFTPRKIAELYPQNEHSLDKTNS